MRVLGVPSVADRVAQTVVAQVVEAEAEKVFRPDSYGYRSGRSALDAVGVCRSRCWKYDWVVEFDIRAFFDMVPHNLVVKAVRSVCDLPWVVLCVKRWLVAPLALPGGGLRERDRGTPQGSAVSPVLANLFLHYAFDGWMAREYPDAPFERYAGDAVVHCSSLERAQAVLVAIGVWLAGLGLELHPGKTRIVYCRDGKRRGSYEHESFTFLGYTFRPRGARRKDGEMFLAFLPAVSKDALTRMGAVVRGWVLHRKTGLSGYELARWINPVVRGWMQYYGGVLPLRAVSPPGAYQCLPDAVAATQTQTVAGVQEGPGPVGAGREAAAEVLRPLGLGDLDPARLVTRTTRAV